jgi:predicted Zn-dependent peptidase
MAAPKPVVFLLLAGAAFLQPAAAPGQSDIPAHPRELKFPDLEFTPPEREKHRHVLPSGVVVYVVEDHELPLVDVSLLVRAGNYLDPAGKEGLADATGSLLRTGGTAGQTPEEFDEETAFLAANLSSSLGDTDGTLALNCLTKDLDRALELFFAMARTPRFDPARLELWRSQELQALARRNDETAAIEAREWELLLRGPGFFSTERTTRKSIEGLTREDLVRFHEEWCHPRNLIVAVAGDVKPAEVLAKLESHLGGWTREAKGRPAPPVPKPEKPPGPGLYLVDKPTVDQGRCSIGHWSTMRGDPDYHAVFIMNQILGGGGFTSRITSRVRSDEGLAYTATARWEFGVYYPGTFRALFQSKSQSVARAAAIVLEEIARMRTEKPSADELETAINHAIGLLPRSFITPSLTASTLANDELTGRDPAFWRTYKAKMAAVTADDVLRAARERLHPEKLLVLIVGDRKGILEAGRETLIQAAEKHFGVKEVVSIPLPDPLTLERP